MISSVAGVVLSAGLDCVVIDVGGVGLLLHTTAGTAASLSPGGKALLATTLVVREESLTLYGFANEDERTVFNLVQTVSGVGPRLALAMLTIHTPDGLRRAVSGGDLSALTKVPGIGKKGAERIVLELRDKIGMPSDAASSPTSRPAAADWSEQVREALVGLGWSLRQAEDTVETIKPEAGEGADVSALLRAALRELGR
ncbi:MAG: Holliday junction branch migration protein RuvA [Dermatophilaceae bacterium]